MAELNWTDAQWQKVNDAVNEAFGKASVASAFLPTYGPLSGSAEIVRNERLTQDNVTVRLDADHASVNRRLVNLTVKVELSSEQVAEESLSNAILAFRRAANVLAQEQDRIVFEGYRRGFPRSDSAFVANAVGPQQGLADLPARQKFPSLDRRLVPAGRAVVAAVVAAIHRLEDTFNSAPFACVLSNTLFDAVHDPSASLVLPADRITPLLKGGPLLRAGRMSDGAGVVISLAGNAVDIVVGTPPTVQFLQRREDARFLFRVYERFVLRIRDARNLPAAGFRTPLSLQERDEELQQLELVAAQRVASEAVQLVEDLI